MTDMEAMWAWFRTCPYLEAGRKVGVNYLPDRDDSYSIYSIPTMLVTEMNVLGEMVPKSVQTQQYMFASQDTYGADTATNMQILALFDKVIEWIIMKNEKREFPAIQSGDVMSIVPTLSASPVDANASTARYEISLKLIYRRI